MVVAGLGNERTALIKASKSSIARAVGIGGGRLKRFCEARNGGAVSSFGARSVARVGQRCYTRSLIAIEKFLARIAVRRQGFEVRKCRNHSAHVLSLNPL